MPNPDSKLFQVAESEKDMIIYGPASVTTPDDEGERTRDQDLDLALAGMLRRGRFTRNHEDVISGEILPVYVDDLQRVWRTEVKQPTEMDLELFPYLAKDADKRHLFTVGNVYADTPQAQKTRGEVESGELDSFSISGGAMAKQGGDLIGTWVDAVTLCEQGMHPGAKFKVIAKSKTHKIHKEEKTMPEEQPAQTAPNQPPAAPADPGEVVDEAAAQINQALAAISEVASEVKEMRKENAEIKKQQDTILKGLEGPDPKEEKVDKAVGGDVGEGSEKVPGATVEDLDENMEFGKTQVKKQKPVKVAKAETPAPKSTDADVDPLKLQKDSEFIKIEKFSVLCENKEGLPVEDVQDKLRKLRKALGEDEHYRRRNSVIDLGIDIDALAGVI